MKGFKRFLSVLAFLAVFAIIPMQIAYTAENAAEKPDSQEPEAPSGLAVINRTHTSVSLGWQKSTDNTEVKGYQIFRDGKKIITTSKTSFTNSDLIPGRKYTYAVKAYDAAGNISHAGTSLDVTTESDDQLPTAPRNPSISNPGFTSLVLSWNPSGDDTGIRGYVIFRNGSRVAATSATSYIVKGLQPGTTYRFSVRAVDVAGNYSMQSSEMPGATLSDQSAPSKPSGLKSTFVSETEILLTWNPSSDNVKVKGYEVICNDDNPKMTTKTLCSFKNRIPGNSYRFSIQAVDSAGNKSSCGDPLTITTLKDQKKPSTPTGLKVVKTKGSSASLSWNASSDNTKVAGYTIYCNGIELATTKKTSRTVKGQSGLGVDIFWVKACDIAGNLSDASNRITILSP